MGNIRPTYIKRTAKKLLSMYQDKFVASDFQHNKVKILELADFGDKLLRNHFGLYYMNLKNLKNSKEEVS